MVSAYEQRLGPLVEPHRKRIAIQTKVLTGTPFLQIIREVVRNGHDLVIKSPDSPDWLDRVFGSDDMHLLRKCPCPIWLAKAAAPKPHRRILAAVDVDEGYPPMELKTRHALNLRILTMASSLALAESAELHVVHAWHPVGETAMLGGFMSTTEEEITAYVEQVRLAHTQALHALLRELAGELGQETVEYLKPQTHLIKGWARKEIPVLAKRIEADLIVMGTVARTGVPGFIIGNTAETILSQIDISVLAIKPPGFVTPVTAEG
jgi:nucleotide-binding universal stress UspA family protein